MSDVTVTVDDKGLAACLRLLSEDFADLAKEVRVTAEQADRLDSYGQTRLANSLLPDGAHTSIDVLGFRKTSEGVEMTIASDVPYAGRMHETDRPAEGDYWTPGNGGYGWSTQGTGNKYIEKVVDASRMAQAMADRMNARMRV